MGSIQKDMDPVLGDDESFTEEPGRNKVIIKPESEN